MLCTCLSNLDVGVVTAGSQAPRMVQYLRDTQPPVDVTVEHALDQIDALLAHNPGDSQLMIHDLVDAVEGVLLVDEGVEQDTESPDVLFFAAVGTALEDFGSGIICRTSGF